MSPDIIIIGGGLAGLSASIKLVQAGANVLIIEKNNHLGGRTYSFRDKNTNSVVDNGQHILVGAYKNTFKYLEMIGTRDLLSPKNPKSLNFIENGKYCYKIHTCDILPPPFNLFFGFLALYPLSMNDKINLIKIVKDIKRWGRDFAENIKEKSIENFLNSYEQSENVKKYFWNPLVISVMNESPDIASALLFAKVLNNTYLSKDENNRIWLPSVGQSELYVDKAVEFIKVHKSKIVMNQRVDKLLIEGSKVKGVYIKEKLIESKYVISAVENFNILNLLSEKYHNINQFYGIKNFNSSPIISINLWFDQEIMDDQFVGLINTNVQWLFNRNRILKENNNRLNHLTAVISNARSILEKKKDQIISLAMEELKTNFSKIEKSKLIHYSVIKERRATFSASPEAEKYRPNQETEIENFYIAGDWTNTGLPATIESAVTSGFLCADLILNKR